MGRPPAFGDPRLACAAVLVLLPPSEGKLAPASGAPVDLATLSLPALTVPRRKALNALVKLAKGPRATAAAALGLSPGQAVDVERDRALKKAPAAPAGEVYTGVLFQHLDLATLAPDALARAREHVLVASALWGVVALEDRIPAYRLSMGARLPALTDGGLAAWWRPALARTLPDEPGALVVDLRSGTYAAAWRPERATTVEVKATTADGRTISHMAKAFRGTVARRVLQAAGPPATPADVAELAHDEGAGRVALHAPRRAGGAWTVEVIAPPA
jgi:cytoplasmic iron level regulating protein YaaA (DUF328/UPF0246 family)